MTAPGLNRFLVSALVLAVAVLSLLPRAAHAFCINCDSVSVIEYVNELNGDYLLLPSIDSEVAIVESGRAGPGWQRTGNDFATTTWADRPVCRFYSPVYHSHFYTSDANECAAVKMNPEWVYEKVPFSVFDTALPGCGASVYRVVRGGDHRWTASAALRQQLLGSGWADEGIGFCVRSGGREPLKSISMYIYPALAGTPGCLDINGLCTALEALAPMPNRVPPYLPPFYITINIDYPNGAGTLTGSFGFFDLWTSQAIASQITQHSFLGGNGQVYVKGSDRLAGNYAGISPTIWLPGVAGPTADERIFVWRAVSDRELRVTTQVSVGLVARDGPGAHAYGHPLLEFGDAASGHGFVMTIQAFGTVPPGDFVGADARTGEAIVSTVFRPNPRFGSVLSGSFAACLGDGTTPCGTTAPYVFLLKRADFKAALDLARSVDPSLSGNPADYFLGRVAFHNETYLDARLGATVSGLSADIWYVE